MRETFKMPCGVDIRQSTRAAQGTAHGSISTLTINSYQAADSAEYCVICKSPNDLGLIHRLQLRRPATGNVICSIWIWSSYGQLRGLGAERLRTPGLCCQCHTGLLLKNALALAGVELYFLPAIGNVRPGQPT